MDTPLYCLVNEAIVVMIAQTAIESIEEFDRRYGLNYVPGVKFGGYGWPSFSLVIERNDNDKNLSILIKDCHILSSLLGARDFSYEPFKEIIVYFDFANITDLLKALEKIGSYFANWENNLMSKPQRNIETDRVEVPKGETPPDTTPEPDQPFMLAKNKRGQFDHEAIDHETMSPKDITGWLNACISQRLGYIPADFNDLTLDCWMWINPDGKYELGHHDLPLHLSAPIWLSEHLITFLKVRSFQCSISASAPVDGKVSFIVEIRGPNDASYNDAPYEFISHHSIEIALKMAWLRWRDDLQDKADKVLNPWI